MAFEINGYNDAFQRFVDFAQKRVSVGDGAAVANAQMSEWRLSGRTIVAVEASKTDKAGFFGALFRSHDDIEANVEARNLFMEAIDDMFEGNIPDSVKAAMKLGDYGDKGHPLTARRIIAVRNAIDATGILRAKALAQPPGFTSQATEALAVQKGYSRTELFAVARAVRFYQATVNCDEATAAREVMTPGTKANRLLQYGGRFLASHDNFRNGLRLINDFEGWFANLTRARDFTQFINRDYSQATTITELNVDPNAIVPKNDKGYERFVFQQIAHDPDFNLQERDPERAFGFEHNAASRFIGRELCPGMLSTINCVPPNERRILFAVFDAFLPLAKTPDEAEHKPRLDCKSLLTARVLKNVDKLAVLADKGQLTPKNIFSVCFPDMPVKGRCDVKALNDIFTHCQNTMMSHFPKQVFPAMLELETTGAQLKEVIAAFKSGRRLPPLPHYSPATITLDKYDGTTAVGREALQKDFSRCLTYIDAGKNDLLPADAHAWSVTFPDGTRHLANGAEHRDGIDDIIADVEALCGEAHAPQANAVMQNLSQSGLANLRGGLPEHGIGCNEHSPMNFTLSKDAETGSITIRYSSPDGLPVHFSWETVIDIDGLVSHTTPMIFS